MLLCRCGAAAQKLILIAMVVVSIPTRRIQLLSAKSVRTLHSLSHTSIYCVLCGIQDEAEIKKKHKKYNFEFYPSCIDSGNTDRGPSV